jgi:hypothetical protein
VRVVAFDPGGTTGIVVWEDGQENIEGLHLGPEPHHKDLYYYCMTEAEKPGTFFVCESFQYRNGLMKAELISNEYIGVLKVVHEITDTRLFMQTPAMGKGWMTNPQLQTVGWLFSPPSVSPYKHMNDAARHLAYFMMHNTNVPVGLRAELLRKRSGR